ncbi:NADH dehydrogenase subunit 2 (mitochondrion) [Syngnathoides biaculeatus]|uniref:NADH-ubiquinone oxidoreductase chain 2 n=1 Tax=Syngnathoides biaculeatus TaxID=300417 RepID=A0A342CFU7_9TELE|nr:NADH dehydrogenase subunit 2 [Syngnathoides biaculeatus]AHN95944.1 NADH dehydrogenase subunit 2 [Syngnathoides biaculeatus]AWI49227.1 NADH dehydrogenase subunit 2 [Syngnathoides biaculeatus]
MNPYILFILISSLGLGTTITFMSSHWLLAWMGLEINTLAIIPLMAQHHHPRSVEASTKYFLTQATAAAMILFASSTNAWLTGQWAINQLSHPLPIMLITMALALKIGLAPLHTWLPEVLQGLDLNTGLILSTWQKLAPFALFTQIPQFNPTIVCTMAILSTLVGGWGGLNQTQLRKILAYSSIAHLGWMVIIMQYSPSLTLLTLLIYILMTFSAFNLFKMNKSTSLNMLAISSYKSPMLTALTPLIMLSLAGLPPLTGFGPKWLILQELTKQDLTFMATVTALSALLSLYFYLRLSYTMTLLMSPNNTPGTAPWRLNTSCMTFPLSASLSTSILLLPILPALMVMVK